MSLHLTNRSELNTVSQCIKGHFSTLFVLLLETFQGNAMEARDSRKSRRKLLKNPRLCTQFDEYWKMILFYFSPGLKGENPNHSSTPAQSEEDSLVRCYAYRWGWTVREEEYSFPWWKWSDCHWDQMRSLHDSNQKSCISKLEKSCNSDKRSISRSSLQDLHQLHKQKTHSGL